ncbi:unnamed protein product [Pleuronectes platessa]|uniref:Uncharacterized protein n=1 Tax=Pleuronectes platessa TaxID=8262 RepID=A0A9N7TYG9_PLEPL|nr:unnamed protein product [Pleuronectes platessa]
MFPSYFDMLVRDKELSSSTLRTHSGHLEVCGEESGKDGAGEAPSATLKGPSQPHYFCRGAACCGTEVGTLISVANLLRSSDMFAAKSANEAAQVYSAVTPQGRSGAAWRCLFCSEELAVRGSACFTGGSTAIIV